MNFLRKLFKCKRDRVLFLDLDGTVIVTKSGETFPKDITDWKFKDLFIEALVAYKPTAVHICTNQGGIELGFVNEKEFWTKMDTICDILSTHLGFRPTYAYCKSNDKSDNFRKPNPGMIEQYLNDYYLGTDYNRKDCLMIGDASGKPGQFSDSDLQFAKNAGIKYCDVDDFISCLDPCHECKEADLDCTCGEYPSMQPCFDSFDELLAGKIK